MKKHTVIVFVIFILPLVSCIMFREVMTIQDLLIAKQKMDKTENPARKRIIKHKLSEQGLIRKKLIKLEDVLVKDVIQSTNIDYDYCVIVDVTTEKGMVECYVYSKNIYKISKLEKGKTKIDVTGVFGRFFTMLDEYYTKMDIIKASIKIRDSKENK